MDFLIVLAILFVVVFMVSAPLRREAMGRDAAGSAAVGTESAAAGGETNAGTDAEAIAELAELEAARDAKYREIRDAELDFRTGKLSEADYRSLDEGLRAEAMEILRALDAAHARAGATIGEQ